MVVLGDPRPPSRLRSPGGRRARRVFSVVGFVEVCGVLVSCCCLIAALPDDEAGRFPIFAFRNPEVCFRFLLVPTARLFAPGVWLRGGARRLPLVVETGSVVSPHRQTGWKEKHECKGARMHPHAFHSTPPLHSTFPFYSPPSFCQSVVSTVLYS